jgi:hypothetical protein
VDWDKEATPHYWPMVMPVLILLMKGVSYRELLQALNEVQSQELLYKQMADRLINIDEMQRELNQKNNWSMILSL